MLNKNTLNDSIEQIKKLKELLDKQDITQDEFERLKQEVLFPNIPSSPVNHNGNIQKKFKMPYKLLGGVLGFSLFVLFAFYFINKKSSTLVPYLKANGKYVYVDSANMKIILDKEYDEANLFSNGLARVKISNKWGFVTIEGKEIIPIEYDDTHDFSEGIAAVKKNNKWGFVSTTGKLIIPIKYEDVDLFSEGLARVKIDDKWGFINKEDKEIINSKYFYINNFSEGYALFTYTIRSEFKYGFVDKSGKEVYLDKYDIVEDFKDGIAQVGRFWKQPSGGDFYDDEAKYGFIDNKFNEIISLKYLNCAGYNEGLIAVKEDNHWGYIDKNDNIKIPFKFNYANQFVDGVAVVSLNDKKGLINTKGDYVIDCIYQEIRTTNNQSLLPFKNDNKWGYLNEKGEVIIKNNYAPLSTNEIGFDEIGYFNNGFAKVRLEQTEFYIDKAGREFKE